MRSIVVRGTFLKEKGEKRQGSEKKTRGKEERGVPIQRLFFCASLKARVRIDCAIKTRTGLKEVSPREESSSQVLGPTISRPFHEVLRSLPLSYPPFLFRNGFVRERKKPQIIPTGFRSKRGKMSRESVIAIGIYIYIYRYRV